MSTTTTTTIRYWEAFTAAPLAERHQTHFEETPEEGPASVWTCGHQHRYQHTAEECAERSYRELSGPNGTEVQYVGVRRVGA